MFKLNINKWEGVNISGSVIIRHQDGRVYDGECISGRPHGKGTYKLHDGSKYSGEWKYGVINGKGIFVEFSGVKDAGQFKDGTLWKGTRIFENGDKFVGEWKNGEEWNIDYFDKYGEFIGQIYKEGKFPINNNLKIYDKSGNLSY